MSVLYDELTAALPPEAILTGDDVTGRSAGIWGPPRRLQAAILVRPRDTEEISKVLAICDRHRQAVVTQGGLTGVVDGALAGADDLILSMERMTGVESVDPLGATLTVRAGTTLQTVQDEAANHGLMFALDLGARGSATIGGNAATNAGGNRVIRYGMVRSLILGLEAVLADGTIVSSMNRMLKNNAGYDLKQLFIGTEGTLGIITRLVLRLGQQPTSQDTALVAMNDFAQVGEFLRHMESALAGTLSAYEVLWQDYYGFVTGQTDREPPLAPTFPYYVLVEALGGDVRRDTGRFEDALASAFESGLAVDAVIAKSQSERAGLWAIRDDVVRLLDLDPVFLFDVSLPIDAVEAYVQDVRQALTDVWPEQRQFTFGHLGDGNIHLVISAGSPDGSARERVERIIYGPLRQLGGSISGEHGIGLEKKPYLDWCRSDTEIALMKKVKSSLDPNGILNPGKIF